MLPKVESFFFFLLISHQLQLEQVGEMNPVTDYQLFTPDVCVFPRINKSRLSNMINLFYFFEGWWKVFFFFQLWTEPSLRESL